MIKYDLSSGCTGIAQPNGDVDKSHVCEKRHQVTICCPRSCNDRKLNEWEPRKGGSIGFRDRGDGSWRKPAVCLENKHGFLSMRRETNKRGKDRFSLASYITPPTPALANDVQKASEQLQNGLFCGLPFPRKWLFGVEVFLSSTMNYQQIQGGRPVAHPDLSFGFTLPIGCHQSSQAREGRKTQLLFQLQGISLHSGTPARMNSEFP
ncbi:Hypothetical predicted protein [Scomber scombrus]|uniref:Uncharacterized protein n=1 Tax=Scomber scombrus TaxID=13677 RepID=A0AAV1P182_SCOSC